MTGYSRVPQALSIMDQITAVRYRIDPDDRLTEFSDGWVIFAAANDGEAIQPPNILGRSLWEFIADATTRHLYRTMVERVRAGGLPIRFQFRCDAASLRRLLAMEITADGVGGTQFSVTSVVEQGRPSVRLLDPHEQHVEGELLTMCSWCKRIPLLTGGWVEVEEAVQALGLFGIAPLPCLTHGMCPSCHAAITETLASPLVGAAGMVTVGAIQAA